MVIFVLLIWLWVWCNAVAGYFVPYALPFVPTSRQIETYSYCNARGSEPTLHGSPFISDDVSGTLMKLFATDRYTHEKHNESVTSMIYTIGFAAAPLTTDCYLQHFQPAPILCLLNVLSP